MWLSYVKNLFPALFFIYQFGVHHPVALPYTTALSKLNQIQDDINSIQLTPNDIYKRIEKIKHNQVFSVNQLEQNQNDLDFLVNVNNFLYDNNNNNSKTEEIRLIIKNKLSQVINLEEQKILIDQSIDFMDKSLKSDIPELRTLSLEQILLLGKIKCKLYESEEKLILISFIVSLAIEDINKNKKSITDKERIAIRHLFDYTQSLITKHKVDEQYLNFRTNEQNLNFESKIPHCITLTFIGQKIIVTDSYTDEYEVTYSSVLTLLTKFPQEIKEIIISPTASKFIINDIIKKAQEHNISIKKKE